MTKEEAASQLGISVRTLQRLMTTGQIQYSTTRNPHGGTVASFDSAEVERIRKERDTTLVVHHATTALVPQESNGNGHALTRSDAMMAELVQAISKAKPTVAIDQKVWLTWEQAVDVAGLPKTEVYKALRNGKLPAIKVGGRWRVQRDRVVTWARKFTV